MLCALAAGLATGCALAEPPGCEGDDRYACFRGAFRDLIGTPVGAVEVCTPDLPDVDCVTADDDGTWKLPGLPLDDDVLVTATAPGAVPTVFAQTTTMDWYSWFKVMVPASIMDTNASNVGTSLDPDRGHVLFLTWEGLNLDGVDTARVGGVTVDVAGGEGQVFYGNVLGLASASATATTSNGSGGVLNLAPGTHILSFEAVDRVCGEQMFHFAPTDDGGIPVPVLAGYTTAIDVMCPPP